MHVYDEKLKDYGISEEVFNGFDMEASVALNILESAVLSQNAVAEITGIVIPTDSIKDTLGEDMDSERVLALAKAGLEYDENDKVKAKAYDKLVTAAIDDALKSGVRAKGENFNETKWKKILSSLEYEDIIDQQKEWESEAKVALHAGVRASQPWMQENKRNTNVNVADYSFAKG